MLKLAALSCISFALMGMSTATNTAQATTYLKSRCSHVYTGIQFWRSATWKWQEQHDAKRTPTRFHEQWVRSCKYGKWLARLWHHRAVAAKKEFWSWYRAKYSKWDCIHQHEAGWHGDSNPTYDGGLQMDSEFQYTYGKVFVRRWGQASNWPVWAQLLAAERAYATRGFDPWPTRRYCGL